ncbi:MAG: hypothetical protein Q9162_006479 [Coniocarpon cinnabarinum]
MGPLHSAHPFALTHDPKPTIVFVPNAWFPSAAYAPFLAHIQQREYPLQCVDHPSLGPPLQESQFSNQTTNPFNTSAALDADALYRNVLHRLIEREGCDVVLLVHGYGSKPGLSAVYGLHKATRFRQDLPGGVLGIIGISPMVLSENTRLEHEQGPLPSWSVRDTPYPGYCLPSDPYERFAQDCSPDAAQNLMSQIRPMTSAAFESLQPPNILTDDDFEGCLAAIVLGEDRVLPVPVQENLLASSGKTWLIERMQCSHSAPFIERAAEVTDVIESMIEAFEQRLDERWMAETEAARIEEGSRQ